MAKLGIDIFAALIVIMVPFALVAMSRSEAPWTASRSRFSRLPGDRPGPLLYRVNLKAETLLRQRHHHVRFSLLGHGLGTDRLGVNVVAFSVSSGRNADHLVIFNHRRHLDHLPPGRKSAIQDIFSKSPLSAQRRVSRAFGLEMQIRT